MTLSPIAIATFLGLAGLLPFLALSLLTVVAWSYQAQALAALIAYGACILSFLGAVHWGFLLGSDADSPRRPALRLTLGVLPSLIGFLALVITQAGAPMAGLTLIWLGVLLTWGTEHRFAACGWLPHGYLRLRTVLSATVVLLLMTVELMHLLGIGFQSVNFLG